MFAVVRAWRYTIDHSLDIGFGANRNNLNVRMLIAENPENLIGKCLADFLDAQKVQEHFRELFESRENALRL